jgi:hypothetical protein
MMNDAAPPVARPAIMAIVPPMHSTGKAGAAIMLAIGAISENWPKRQADICAVTIVAAKVSERESRSASPEIGTAYVIIELNNGMNTTMPKVAVAESMNDNENAADGEIANMKMMQKDNAPNA